MKKQVFSSSIDFSSYQQLVISKHASCVQLPTYLHLFAKQQLQASVPLMNCGWLKSISWIMPHVGSVRMKEVMGGLAHHGWESKSQRLINSSSVSLSACAWSLWKYLSGVHRIFGHRTEQTQGHYHFL